MPIVRELFSADLLQQKTFCTLPGFKILEKVFAGGLTPAWANSTRKARLRNLFVVLWHRRLRGPTGWSVERAKLEGMKRPTVPEGVSGAVNRGILA